MQTAPSDLVSGEGVKERDEIRIADLLQMHDDNKGGLELALGDGLLRGSVSAYARVFELTRLWDVQLSCAQNDLSVGYRAWPYMWIPFLVEERLVPFTDNVTALRAIVDREPNLSVPRDCLHQTFAQNNLQHETCHVLAHLILAEAEVGASLDAPQRRLLHIALSEAMAVATGVMCAADLPRAGPTANELYALNGLPTNEGFLADLRNAGSILGPKHLFELSALGAALRALDAPLEHASRHDYFCGAVDEAALTTAKWCLVLGSKNTNFSIASLGTGYLKLHGCAEYLPLLQQQLNDRSPTGFVLLGAIKDLRRAFFGDEEDTG